MKHNKICLVPKSDEEIDAGLITVYKFFAVVLMIWLDSNAHLHTWAIELTTGWL